MWVKLDMNKEYPIIIIWMQLIFHPDLIQYFYSFLELLDVFCIEGFVFQIVSSLRAMQNNDYACL